MEIIIKILLALCAQNPHQSPTGCFAKNYVCTQEARAKYAIEKLAPASEAVTVDLLNKCMGAK